MEKVLQDLHDAKQQILNFTDGRHYRVVKAITTAEQYIKDQNDKLDQYRKALIANVLLSTRRELARDLTCLCMLAMQEENNSVTISLEMAEDIVDALSGEENEEGKDS